MTPSRNSDYLVPMTERETGILRVAMGFAAQLLSADYEASDIAALYSRLSAPPRAFTVEELRATIKLSDDALEVLTSMSVETQAKYLDEPWYQARCRLEAMLDDQ